MAKAAKRKPPGESRMGVKRRLAQAKKKRPEKSAWASKNNPGAGFSRGQARVSAKLEASGKSKRSSKAWPNPGF
jgi:hypothetical protein